MAGGAGRRGLPMATLLGLLALLAGPVAAANDDGLNIESQLYITAGLLGGLGFALTIAVVYLLLTLNRIQSDVLSLKSSISPQKQEKQQPTTQREYDVKDPEDPLHQPPPASQQQSQSTSQMQVQTISQQQSNNTSQPQSLQMSQSQPMPRSQPVPQYQPDSQHQMNDARNSSYQQESSYQPATSPGYTSAPLRQQSYGGPAQRPESVVPHGALRREPSYGGAPVAAYGFPAQAPQRRPTAPNAYDSSGSVYPRNRY